MNAAPLPQERSSETVCSVDGIAAAEPELAADSVAAPESGLVAEAPPMADPIADPLSQTGIVPVVTEEPEAELAVLTIGGDAKWFQVGEGPRVDLSRRRPLTRILWALTRARGSTLVATDLIEAGWPGERIVRHAARIRLRVAIATLRGMGLARHIFTTRTGYAVPPDVIVASDAEETREFPAVSEGVRTVTSIPPELEVTESVA